MDPMQYVAILFPLSMVIIALRQKGIARTFIEAGAVSPDTARRPEALKFPRGLGHITHGVRSGVLVPLGDGRFYADTRVYKRRRIGTIAGVVIVALAVGALLWLLRR